MMIDVRLIDLPNLTTFTIGDDSFSWTNSLNLDGMMIDVRLIDLIFLNSLHSLQDIIHSIKQIV